MEVHFFADTANAEYHAPPAYSIKFREARTEDITVE
jgi:hypothetical protein